MPSCINPEEEVFEKYCGEKEENLGKQLTVLCPKSFLPFDR